MARFFFALLLIVVALFQAVILPAATDLALVPNLVLVLLLVWVAVRGVTEGLFWVFGAGLVLDILALDRFGTNALALLPIVAAGAVARRRVFQNAVIVPVLLAVVATLAYGVVLSLVRSLTAGEGLPPVLTVIRMSLVQALVNAVLVPPCYWLASRVSALSPENV